MAEGNTPTLDSYEERKRKYGGSMWYTSDENLKNFHIEVCKEFLKDFDKVDPTDDIFIFSLDFILCNYPDSFTQAEKDFVHSLVLDRVPHNDALEFRDGHVFHKDIMKQVDDQVMIFAFLNHRGDHLKVFEEVGLKMLARNMKR